MREEAKLNPNKKLAEAMKPKKGDGIVIKEAQINESVGTIPKGAFLPFSLRENLSSQTNEKEDVILLRTEKNLISKDGYILILKGSSVANDISDIKVGKYFVRNGKIKC